MDPSSVRGQNFPGELIKRAPPPTLPPWGRILIDRGRIMLSFHQTQCSLHYSDVRNCVLHTDYCVSLPGNVSTPNEAQEGSPPQVTRSLFFKAPGHQVTFFHEKIKTTQVTGRFFKLSRSRGRPQNGPRSQVAKNPSWASLILSQTISFD